MSDKLKALGANHTRYQYDRPESNLLETFKNPNKNALTNAVLSIHIEAPEFTSLCPITGQPDFATIVIDYTPRLLCIESKSLKLYLGSYRNHGEFHEGCVMRIGIDLLTLLAPLHLIVEGRFTPRGGIPFWPRYDYFRP